MRKRCVLACLAAAVACAQAAGQPGGVAGEVLGPVGLGVPDARVTLFVESLAYFAEARTDGGGGFTIEGVPAGSYRLGAAALGLEYQERGVVVGGGVIFEAFALGEESEPGRWDIIGNTLPELFDATDIGVLLPDGRAMFCHDTIDPIIFDPADGSKFLAAGSGTAQGCMNVTLLPDGRVVMAGGQKGKDPGSFTKAIPWVKAYDAVLDAWAQLPDMQHRAGRWYPGLARLADGSLLVMGGGTSPSAVRTDTCEVMDLGTFEWSYTGTMLNPCEFPPSALLHTGEVLATWSPPQLWNRAAGRWRATGNFKQPNRGWPGHSDHSIVVLSDGRVLAVGINKGPDNNTVMGEVYDPKAGTWSLTSNPGLVRRRPEVVQLPDGRVLVAAGETEASPPPVPHVLGMVKWSDLYDPGTGSWRRVADMNHFREYHAVTLLVPDGRVITTGGTRIKFQIGPTSADVEAFVPPYLLRGVRPQITAVPGPSARRGETLELEIFPQTKLTSVVLIGTGAHTHWVEAGVPRRLVLPVKQSGAAAWVGLPMGENLAPLGRYMLFAMVDDIPSEGAILELVANPCPPDFTGDGALNIDDFVAFQLSFALGEPRADFNGDLAHDIEDFIAFQLAFAIGC